MKKIISLMTLSCSLAFGIQMNITSIQAIEDFDARFLLTSSQENQSVVLDCQSFFQKIDFFVDDEIQSENFISINECEWLFDKTRACLRRNREVCLDSDDLWSDSCKC